MASPRPRDHALGGGSNAAPLGIPKKGQIWRHGGGAGRQYRVIEDGEYRNDEVGGFRVRVPLEDVITGERYPQFDLEEKLFWSNYTLVQDLRGCGNCEALGIDPDTDDYLCKTCRVGLEI